MIKRSQIRFLQRNPPRLMSRRARISGQMHGLPETPCSRSCARGADLDIFKYALSLIGPSGEAASVLYDNADAPAEVLERSHRRRLSC
jgi:hypothetical protein